MSATSPCAASIKQSGVARDLPAHIPSLDGLRAISVLLVIAGHAALYGPDTGQWSLFSSLFLNSEVGVTWFFVISGFLITTLLIREQENTGNVSLTNFYIRRAYRILPPLYALILVVIFLKFAWGLAIPGQRIWSAATFTYNIIKHPAWGGWWLGHTWSLSVEEQFYLCWPCLLVAAGIKRARVAAVVLVLLAPVFRVSLLLLHPEFADQISGLLPSRMDALMLGALAALCYTLPTFHAWMKRLSGTHLWIFTAFVFAVEPVLKYKLGNLYLFSLGFTLEAACLLVILLFSINRPSSHLGRILNFKGLTLVGIVSYDIYLWQQIFITPRNTTFTGLPGVNLAFVALLAFASYRWIDQPFRALGRRLVKS